MARMLGLEIATLEIRQAEDIAPAFGALKGQAEALYVCADPLVGTYRVRINTFSLVARLPAPERMQAQMSARGSSVKIPLRYLRTQPILSPKIQLSDQRQERVDVRVLPIIFRFAKPAGITLYPGQLVDVFIGSR